MASSYVPRRPDYVAGYIDRVTGRKHGNIGGGWTVEQGRIRLKLNVVVPIGQVIVLFPNQYKDEPVGSRVEATVSSETKTGKSRITYVPCAQCGSTERCWCAYDPPSDGPEEVAYVYHDDCEGVS